MHQDPFEHIGQQLRDLEVMPSSQATFEEVIRRREKKRRGAFFWFQRFAVVGVIGLFWFIGDMRLKDTPSTVPNSTSNLANQASEKLPLNPGTSKELTEENIKVHPTTKVQPPSLSKSKSSPSNTPKINASGKTGLFGVFEKFNDRRNRMFNGNVASSNKGAAGLKSLSVSSHSIAEKTWSQQDTRDLLESNQRERGSMALANVYDYGAKSYISKTWFDFQLKANDLDYLDWDFHVPSAALRYKKKPWYVEFSAITGSDNQIQFDPDEQMSILGTNYMAQYQLNWLRECQGIGMWGLGVQYTQWVGNGEWRKKEYVEIPQIDTQLIAINVPGLPTQYIQSFDTTMVRDVSVSTGEINYQIDKIAIPIAFRGFTRLFKTNFRYGIQFAPGITRMSKGAYFTPTEFMPLEKKSQFTMGAKIGVGPMIPINPNLNIIIEPALMYQSFLHPEKGMKGRVFGGLGISMMWRLR